MNIWNRIKNWLIPAPGSIYIFRRFGNPFLKPHKIEVLAVQDGFVNYRWLEGSLWQDESMTLWNFHGCYRRYQIEAASMRDMQSAEL